MSRDGPIELRTVLIVIEKWRTNNACAACNAASGMAEYDQAARWFVRCPVFFFMACVLVGWVVGFSRDEVDTGGMLVVVGGLLGISFSPFLVCFDIIGTKAALFRDSGGNRHFHQMQKNAWPYLEWQVEKGQPRVPVDVAGKLLLLRRGGWFRRSRVFTVTSNGMADEWKLWEVRNFSFDNVTIVDSRGRRLTADALFLLDIISRNHTVAEMETGGTYLQSRYQRLGRGYFHVLRDFEESRGSLGRCKHAKAVKESIHARLLEVADTDDIVKWEREVRASRGPAGAVEPSHAAEAIATAEPAAS